METPRELQLEFLKTSSTEYFHMGFTVFFSEIQIQYYSFPSYTSSLKYQMYKKELFFVLIFFFFVKDLRQNFCQYKQI